MTAYERGQAGYHKYRPTAEALSLVHIDQAGERKGQSSGPHSPPGFQAAGGSTIFNMGLPKLPEELGSWKGKKKKKRFLWARHGDGEDTPAHILSVGIPSQAVAKCTGGWEM